MFRRARPAAADAASATTADTAPGRGRSDKRSWASMSERLRQQRQDGRRFGEAGDADAADAPSAPSAPHPEPAPDTAAGRSDGAVAATPAAVQAAARAPAAQGTPADRDAPRGQDPAFAFAVRQALGEALAAAPRQPDLEPETRQAETRQAEPGTAEDSSMPVARSADEHKQPARPSGNGRAAAPAAEPERGFGHKQPAPALPAASTSANALLGHVISVAGSVVWAVLDPTGATHAEIGAMVRLQGGQMRSFGIITTLKSEGERSAAHDRRLVEIKLLGEMAAGTDRFQRGVSSHPALDSLIYMASRDELRAVFARPDKPTVRLGTLHQASDLPAYAITDNLLGKHFAVLGTTGAGKSCAVTVILRAILAANPHGHIIMLDPHNEYAPAFGARAELLNPGNLKLPYWLLNFEEIAEVLVSKDSPERAYAEIGDPAPSDPRRQAERLRQRRQCRPCHGRHALPLPALGAGPADQGGDGRLQQGGEHGALPAPDRAHRQRHDRQALRFHVLELHGQRHHGAGARPHPAHSGRRQAGDDHRSVRGAVRDRRRDGLGAVPAGVRVRPVEPARQGAAHPSGVRGGAPLRAARRSGRGSRRPSGRSRASPRKAASTASACAW